MIILPSSSGITKYRRIIIRELFATKPKIFMLVHKIVLSTFAERRTASTFPRNIALVLAAAKRRRKGEVETLIRAIIISDIFLPVPPDVKDFDFARTTEGKYAVLFFYPLDFTFVCPTELIAFDHRLDDFQAREVEVAGVSVGSHYTYNAWRNTRVDHGGIIRFAIRWWPI